MALIKCSECGHMVSDKAESCPNCGNPKSTETTNVQTPTNVQNKSNETAIVVLLGLLITWSLTNIICNLYYIFNLGNETPNIRFYVAFFADIIMLLGSLLSFVTKKALYVISMAIALFVLINLYALYQIINS